MWKLDEEAAWVNESVQDHCATSQEESDTVNKYNLSTSKDVLQTRLGPPT